MLRLTFERKRRGWSQTELGYRAADLLGKPTRLRIQTIISRLELEQSAPTEEELQTLATVLDIAPAYALLRHVVLTAQDVDAIADEPVTEQPV